MKSLQKERKRIKKNLRSCAYVSSILDNDGLAKQKITKSFNFFLETFLNSNEVSLEDVHGQRQIPQEDDG